METTCVRRALMSLARIVDGMRSEVSSLHIGSSYGQMSVIIGTATEYDEIQ